MYLSYDVASWSEKRHALKSINAIKMRFRRFFMSYNK